MTFSDLRKRKYCYVEATAICFVPCLLGIHIITKYTCRVCLDINKFAFTLATGESGRVDSLNNVQKSIPVGTF